jgi:branched-subunit amino acid aminotransferase/4-amino-4-deoxychorismate lyase
MNLGLAYFNGEWIDASSICLPLDDIGFLLGATVVERLRTFSHQPFRVDDHVRRLRRSLEIVGWDAARLAAEVERALRDFPGRNAAHMAPDDDWSLVALLTPGKTPDAAQPTVCVHGFPLPFAGWAQKFEEGVALRIVSVRQVPASCWPPEMKCRSRIHYYLADREAARYEPDSRALLLDQDGFVGEASTANVVCYFRDRGLVTPQLAKVLPGISQEVLFELAREQGVSHAEDDLTPERFMAADEIFLTSTSVCLMPVVRVDGRQIGTGRPGPLFQRFMAAWTRHVGVDIVEQARQFAVRP